MRGGVQSTWDSFRYSNISRIDASFSTGAHFINAGVDYKMDENGNLLYLNPDYGRPYRYQQLTSFRLGVEVSF